MTVSALIVLVIWIVILFAVVALLIWALDYAASGLGMPARLVQILKILIVVVAVLIVIMWLLGALPGPPAITSP